MFRASLGRACCGALFNLGDVVGQGVKLHYTQQPQGRIPSTFHIVICLDATSFCKARATREDDLADSTHSAGRHSLWFAFDGPDDAYPLHLAENFILQTWPTNKTPSFLLSSQSSNRPSSHKVWCPLVSVMSTVGSQRIGVAAFSGMRKRSWGHPLDKVRLGAKWSLATVEHTVSRIYDRLPEAISCRQTMQRNAAIHHTESDVHALGSRRITKTRLARQVQ